MELNKIYNVDCIGEYGMKNIEDKSVDMILCDLPYGTTACKWDSIIDLQLLWKQYGRIIKDNGAVVLSSSQPFTTKLIESNINMFRYCLVWEKSRPTLFQHAWKMPLKSHEDICIFYKKLPTYNPQGLVKEEKVVKRTSGGGTFGDNWNSENEYTKHYTNFPRSVLKFASEGKTVHPTQKPVTLFEYLIKTYTNEGMTVLDNTAGSMTTAVACDNLKRNWICMEMDDVYCELGLKRVNENREKLGMDRTEIVRYNKNKEEGV